MSRWLSYGITTADAITSTRSTLLLPKQALPRIACRTSGSHIRSQPVRNIGAIVLWLIVDERNASAKDRRSRIIRCMSRKVDALQILRFAGKGALGSRLY